jgi:hypothetical protein
MYLKTNLKRSLILCGFVGLSTISAIANAASFSFNGNITNHNDIVRIDFNLAQNATNVRVWTDSFLAPDTSSPGVNFDPITALWNATTGALISTNDDNPNIALGQTYFDSGFSLATLVAGDYFFTVAAYDNFNKGANIANGFAFDTQTPIPIGQFNQPANGSGHGGFWRVNLDGVDGATGPVNPSAVPVPGAVWLFGSAIAAFAGFGRRKTF